MTERDRTLPGHKIKPTKVVFQGEPGANSPYCLQRVIPRTRKLCRWQHLRIVLQRLKQAMLNLEDSIENSVAGRVADIHLSSANVAPLKHYVNIFLPIHHQLMGLGGADTNSIHIRAKPCHRLLANAAKLSAKLGLLPGDRADTAGSGGPPFAGALQARLQNGAIAPFAANCHHMAAE